ncbi:MAG: 50S ribosomal protein L29 [Porphyromonadaceae bacterium]|nr:MAG: 50S ribosomal protein L29 [Porphyromonadaceae bacterium]
MRAEKEYVQTKIQHSISPLDNPAKITVDRRNIARMKNRSSRSRIKKINK